MKIIRTDDNIIALLLCQIVSLLCSFCYCATFYRAMHFSAERGLAIACRLSVCPSVCDVGDL